ncbi:MAG: ribonucleotide reductase N-terminal alpha domain-containing protein, partial [Candidatus ainarchaeum sp.]|nr:ribonucleotide reductase N-terminal alpha domain-containing protein [Candidatus ainarchaeum sp.]
MVKQISKRDGTIVAFDPEKIRNVVWKAVQAVGGKDRAESDGTADFAIELIHQKFGDGVPTVEDVQDLVEKALIEKGHATTAKAYILYRHKKSVEREVKGMMGVKDDLKLSLNAVQVLERRYLLKDENGKITETPSQLLRRVAKFIASGEKLFGADDEAVNDFENAFYVIMSKMEFLPIAPRLMNAGTNIGHLSACFVLGIGDDLDEIFESVKNTAIIH